MFIRSLFIVIISLVINACVEKPNSPEGFSSPQNVVLVNGDSQVTLSWKLVADVQMEIHRSDAAEFAPIDTTLLYITEVGVNQYIDDSVVNDTIYYYRLISVQGEERSGPSITLEALPTAIPEVPKNVNVSAGDNQVTLSWTLINVEKYEVHRSNSVGFTPDETTLIHTTEIGVGSFTDVDVTNGSVYYYRIIAVKGEIKSAPSIAVEGLPALPSVLPQIPINLIANQGDQQVTLTWSAIADEQYEVYRGGNIDFTLDGSTLIKITTVGVGAYTDLGLINDNVYYYRLVAVKDAEKSAASAPVEGHPTAPPQTVSSVIVSNGDGQVSLTWTAIATEQYEIHRGATTGFTPDATTLIKTTLLGAGSFTDTALSNDSLYYYRLITVKGANRSAPSATVEGLPTAAPQTVSSVIVSNGDGQVSLTWTAIAAEQYEIHRDATTGFTPDVTTLIKTTLLGAGSFTDTALSNDTLYYYRLITVKGANRSAPSGTVEGRPTAPLAVPAGLNAVSGDAQVTLAWIPVANLTYEVHRGRVSDFVANGATLIFTTTTGKGDYIDTDVVNSSVYFYRLIAVNGTAKSAPTVSVLAAPVAATAPLAPTLGVSGLDSAIQLSLTSSVAPDSYKVYFNTTGSVTKADALAYSGTLSSATHLALNNNQLYYYRASAVTGGQEGQLSAEQVGFPFLVKTSWVKSYPTHPVGIVQDVIYTGVQYLAVGTNSLTMTSPDGMTWTARDTGTSPPQETRRLAHDGNGIVMMATRGGLYHSEDYGTTWALVPRFATDVPAGSQITDTTQVDGVFYLASTTPVFVAFIRNYKVSSSDGGVTWTYTKMNRSFIYQFVHDGVRFFARDYDGVYSSSDGVSWSIAYAAAKDTGGQNFIETFDYLALAGNTTKGVVYIGATDATLTTVGHIYSCTPVTTPLTCSIISGGSASNGFRSVAYSPTLDAYYRYAGGLVYKSYGGTDLGGGQILSVGNPQVITGTKWIERGTSSHLMLLGDQGTLISSTDGVVWTRNTTNNAVTHVIWDGRQFVAVGEYFSATSIDGANWAWSANNYLLRHVDYDGSVYIAVGSSGSSPAIVSSTDAVTWSPVTFDIVPATGYMRSNASNSTVQVAVGSEGKIYTSGASGLWTTANIVPALSSTLSFMSVAWNGVAFVAIPNGSPTLVYRSTDGLNWSVGYSATDQLKTGLAIKDGVFYLSGTAKLLTSPDGLVWTEKAAAAAINNLYWDGTLFWSERTAISPDAIHWSTVSPTYLFGRIVKSPTATIYYLSTTGIYR